LNYRIIGRGKNSRAGVIAVSGADGSAFEKAGHVDFDRTA